MTSLFIIAAGGTGAKVAESFVHLCAAGLGPDEAHVLLIDGDASSLTRTRLSSVIAVYSQMQAWPWNVRPHAGAAAPAHLFKTKVLLYELTQDFAAGGVASLSALVGDDAEFRRALSALFAPEEMTNALTHGFHGCPNLGSLVVAEYLRHHLTIKGGAGDTASGFLQALRSHLTLFSTEPPAVVVVGSIFGGTGASILPLAKEIVTEVLSDEDAAYKAINTRTVVEGAKKIRWCRVLLLPYYNVALEPNKLAGDPDPDRYDLDSVFALWYYKHCALISPEVPFFLVGSELAARQSRQIPYAPGGQTQKAPPFYPELLGAIGVLDLANQPQPAPGKLVVRHFTNKNPELPDYQDLPATRPGQVTEASLATGEMHRQRLALLLHLAAFYVRWADREPGEFRQGLAQYARASTLTGWNADSDKRLRDNRGVFLKNEGPARTALEYFARVLFWANSMFARDGSGIQFSPEESYAAIHNTMCSIKPDEISVKERPETDNIVAHTCRMCVAAWLRDQASFGGRNHRGHSFGKARALLTDKGGIQLAPGKLNVAEVLVKCSGDDVPLQWETDYRQR